MRVLQKRTMVIWCVLLLLFVAGNGFALDKLPSETLLPKDLIIEKDFQPGNGLSIGLVQVVEGRVVIMHADMLRGYLAKKDLPIFQGDIVVTAKDGRARLAMNDGSILSMARDTRMTINQSVYHQKKKQRSSFFKLLGKARFWIKKLVDIRQSDVKIKTQTAVVGVRGSDFVIEGTPTTTVLTAFDLEGSQLEVVSLAEPGAKPTIVYSNQRSQIKQGASPTKPVFVPSAEREQMKKEFIPIPGPGKPMAPPDFGKPGKPMKPVYFSHDDLIDPDVILKAKREQEKKETETGKLKKAEKPKKAEEPKKAEALYRDLEFTQFIERMGVIEQEEEFLDTKTEEIEPDVIENLPIEDLPLFPETPSE